jgi:hypothetical protein
MHDFESEQLLHPSKLRMILFAMLSVVFVAGGICGINSGDTATGWCVTLFFGLCGIVCILNILPNASHLRLTKEGFEVKSLYRARTYSWSDVHDFRVYEVENKKMVGFDLSDSHPTGATTRKVSSALTGVEDGLPDTYGMKAEALARLMDEWKSRA